MTKSPDLHTVESKLEREEDYQAPPRDERVTRLEPGPFQRLISTCLSPSRSQGYRRPRRS